MPKKETNEITIDAVVRENPRDNSTMVEEILRDNLTIVEENPGENSILRQ